MFSSTISSTIAISEVVVRVWRSGCLTLSERQALRTVLLENRMSEEDRAAIDRLLHAVRRGWIEMLD
ncbi:hypothetical protein POG22_00750 [Geitlerinema sp. CS-897]|uniref:hypothetical protein n=1 Tax=Baaleninema simplex TaxID=2862350 RepID=UPI0008FC0B29|nr:hypothetical protein [Baaleninema simplex]MDC0831538.1 hypothetical protein [Geitlerinema sp. CS-897]